MARVGLKLSAVLCAVLAVAAVMTTHSWCVAQEDSPDSKARHDAMKRRAQMLRLKFDRPSGPSSEALSVRPEPLFRYSAPNRDTTDGTLWVWTDEGRPVALACLFMDPRDGFAWNYELVSLTDEPFTVSGRPDWNWSPKPARQAAHKIDGPQPASLEAARLIQMKALARGFTATEDLDGEQVRLRLLPRPVLRYQAPQSGVTDGAVFLFAYGTNPELAVQIEATEGEDHPWRVVFARLGAAALSVTRDGSRVWQAERVKEWDRRAVYFSHYGPDELEPESRADETEPTTE